MYKIFVFKVNFCLSFNLSITPGILQYYVLPFFFFLNLCTFNAKATGTSRNTSFFFFPKCSLKWRVLPFKKSLAHYISSIASNKQKNQDHFWIQKKKIRIQLQLSQFISLYSLRQTVRAGKRFSSLNSKCLVSHYS